MNDIELMDEKHTAGGVVFGAYGIDDWVTSSHIQRQILTDHNNIVIEGVWIVKTGWSLQEFVTTKAEKFNFLDARRAIMRFSWGLATISTSRGKFNLTVNGAPTEAMQFIAVVDSEFKRAENLIEWVYGERGESISVPLNYRPAVNAAYPWLRADVSSYVDEYLNSSASVIILIGPPGTGKTSFIKNLIHRSGGDAKVTYDSKIMDQDSLFANFIESDARFLIMEDADAFLSARSDGNTMMHRFLNVSDGLISAEGKKLVFSTNLPSVHDIDSALLRPGRCFDILEFRTLTRDEAQAVLDEVGSEKALSDAKHFTLAEVFNTQPSADALLNRKVGFY